MIFPSDRVRKDGESITRRGWEAMKTENRADGRRKRRRRAVTLQKCGGCCVCWPLSLSALYAGNLCALARSFVLQVPFKGLLDLLTNKRDDCQDLTHNLPKSSVCGISGSEEDITEGFEG